MGDKDAGALARWSRLKRRSRDAASARRGGAAPTRVANVEPTAPVRPAPGSEPPAAAPGGDAAVDLPPVEALDGHSDYTPFLKDGVPEKLARAAMRKLWRSDPVFGFRDGLDDYDEDFTIIETIAEAVTGKAAKARAKAKRPAKPKTAEAKAETAKGRTAKGKTAKGKTAKGRTAKGKTAKAGKAGGGTKARTAGAEAKRAPGKGHEKG